MAASSRNILVNIQMEVGELDLQFVERVVASYFSLVDRGAKDGAGRLSVKNAGSWGLEAVTSAWYSIVGMGSRYCMLYSVPDLCIWWSTYFDQRKEIKSNAIVFFQASLG
jgi:hypothetical protein